MPPPPEAPPPPPPPEVDRVVPLTPRIVYRLVEENIIPQEIDNILFLLSGELVMERVDYSRADRLEANRRLRIEDIRDVISVTILDHAEVLSSSFEVLDGEIIISVSFERDESYRLYFSAPAGTPLSLSYFRLKYEPFPNAGPGSFERGTVMYGENEYVLRYAGERPYLLIDAFYEDTVNINSRTIIGRIRR